MLYFICNLRIIREWEGKLEAFLRESWEVLQHHLPCILFTKTWPHLRGPERLLLGWGSIQGELRDSWWGVGGGRIMWQRNMTQGCKYHCVRHYEQSNPTLACEHGLWLYVLPREYAQRLEKILWFSRAFLVGLFRLQVKYSLENNWKMHFPFVGGEDLITRLFLCPASERNDAPAIQSVPCNCAPAICGPLAVPRSVVLL